MAFRPLKASAWVRSSVIFVSILLTGWLAVDHYLLPYLGRSEAARHHNALVQSLRERTIQEGLVTDYVEGVYRSVSSSDPDFLTLSVDSLGPTMRQLQVESVEVTNENDAVLIIPAVNQWDTVHEIRMSAYLIWNLEEGDILNVTGPSIRQVREETWQVLRETETGDCRFRQPDGRSWMDRVPTNP